MSAITGVTDYFKPGIAMGLVFLALSLPGTIHLLVRDHGHGQISECRQSIYGIEAARTEHKASQINQPLMP
jgi:hypothetical protein